MVDAPDPERGKYKRYRSTPRFRARTGADPAEGLAELRALRTGQDDGQGNGQDGSSGQGGSSRRSRSRWRRGARWVLLALAAWIGVSVLVFIVSSLTATGVPSAAVAALDSGGLPPFSATTILVLGLDGRPPGLKEPGAAQDSESGGPVRSDSMMLIRTGGGHTSRMSIPRDTLVDLPGYGLQKINAAYFYGGAALSIREVESFLGIKINHVLVVNFTNFEALVNAMGGVNWTGGCVDSQIDGGAADGGWTLQLRAGTHHLDGLQALLLSQTRENLCNPAWTDLTREMNQQALLANMKSQIFSAVGFIHLPWIAWYAPQTLETDMNAAELAAVASSMTVFGSGKTQVLLPTGSEDVPGVGDSLTVTDAAKQADVARFLAG
jgi:LCP family protein required for cell wall assembly